MDKIILLGFSLLLCWTVAQGLVCNLCKRNVICEGKDNTCVADAKYPYCYTSQLITSKGTYLHFGCADFEPCFTWGKIQEGNKTYTVKCCNTDRCNGFPALKEDNPILESPGPVTDFE